MSILESIQEWGDWDRETTLNDKEELKRSCQSQRYISRIQIQTESMKSQLRSTRKVLGEKADLTQNVIDVFVDEFLVLYRSLLKPLQYLVSEDSAEFEESKSHLRTTDWKYCVTQTLIVLKVLDKIPDSNSDERNRRRHQLSTVVDLCTQLVALSATTWRRNLSSAETLRVVQRLQNMTTEVGNEK